MPYHVSRKFTLIVQDFSESPMGLIQTLNLVLMISSLPKKVSACESMTSQEYSQEHIPVPGKMDTGETPRKMSREGRWCGNWRKHPSQGKQQQWPELLLRSPKSSPWCKPTLRRPLSKGGCSLLLPHITAKERSDRISKCCVRSLLGSIQSPRPQLSRTKHCLKSIRDRNTA